MKEITILSGKGGTGKTSITAALASVVQNAVFCDNDVDAADLHLIFQPQRNEEHAFPGGRAVVIDISGCVKCEICMNHCRFSAIHENKEGFFYINPFQCEGCRLCERICPEKAVSSTLKCNNFWYVSSTRFGTLVHAQMGAGQENSGKLVARIRKKAAELAKEYSLEYVINDGPPGIGCAAISSLSGTNCVLIVIEPTKSGLHDVRRLVDLIETFKTETYAIINKFDINLDVVSKIEKFLKEKNIPLLAKIPFNEVMVEAMTAGKTILEYHSGSAITTEIKNIWETLKGTSNRIERKM